jgi:hypothetical protein
VDLAARPPAGVGVVWTGCSSPTPTPFEDRWCKVALPGDRSVKATFIKTAVRKLSLTVVDQINHPDNVSVSLLRYARKTGGWPYNNCFSAAAPGQTCTWEYSQNACPVDTPNCTMEVRLSTSPPAGARVGWTGCSSSFTSGWDSVCVVELSGDRSVKATIEVDPKGATG